MIQQSDQIAGISMCQWKKGRPAGRRMITTYSIQNRWTREYPPVPAASNETNTPVDFEDSVFYASKLIVTQQETTAINLFQSASHFGITESPQHRDPKFVNKQFSRLYGVTCSVRTRGLLETHLTSRLGLQKLNIIQKCQRREHIFNSEINFLLLAPSLMFKKECT